MTTTIIPPTRSVFTAVLAGLGALATLVLTIALVLDPLVPASASVWIMLLAVLFVGAVGLIALRLAAARGGLFVDDAERVGLGITSARDRWWFERGAIRGVRTELDQRTETWLAVLDVTGHPPIVVASAEERAQIVDIIRLLAEQTGLPVLEEERDVAPQLGSAVVRFGVRHGAALQGVLAAFGLAVIGGGVVTLLQEDRFAALLFGPLLVIIGLVLVTVTIVKRLAHEELSSDGASLTHAFVLGRWRWAERKIESTRPRWRLWLAGMRGGHLEVLGQSQTLVVGAGATARSRMDLGALAAVHKTFGP